ncbi:MAG TPA: hypothetical protein VF062_24785 [Candidatus Limnocylindrales bacterium]
MKPTELLIVAYHGDNELFTTSLTPKAARTIVTAPGADGDSIVRDCHETTTHIFEPIVEMLTDLASPVGVTQT